MTLSQRHLLLTVAVLATSLVIAALSVQAVHARTIPEVERPTVRVVRKRATGERDKRAELRAKRMQYQGGHKEKVAELKFKRDQRRQG